MAGKDKTAKHCLDLAMRSTAFGNHRGAENRRQLEEAILKVTALFPAADYNTNLSKDEAMRIVRRAIRLGRSYGLAGPDFREIFNEVVEEAPPTHRMALDALGAVIHGRTLQ